MGIISDIKENRSQSIGQLDNWLDNLISGFPSSTGMHIDEKRAMTFSAVFACVKILAQDVASLPLNVYEELPEGGRKKAKNNYLYPLLHKKSNNIMTSFTWREVVMAHLLLWGNHYSKMTTDNSGRITGLWPMHPGRVDPIVENKKLYYKHKKEDGTQKIYSSHEILHIPGLGFDGIKGLSVIEYNRNSIGLGLAAEEFGSKFFSNGAHPSGIVEYPEGLKDDARKRLKKDLKEKYSGLGKEHSMMVFEHGMKYHQVSIPPNDAQFLETRIFQVRDVARIFNVPLHKIADMEKGASYSSIEQQSIDYVVGSLRPWLVRIEQTLNDELISSKNTKNYIEFVIEGLLRGDSKARAEYYNQMFQIGAYSPNDALEKENMNPIGPEGDQHFVPLNFIPLEASNPKLGESKKKDRQLRAMRSASKRVNIRNRYKRLIKKSAENIVGVEVEAIRKLIDSELRDQQSFRDKIVSYYSDFPEEVQKEFKPVLRSLADAIAEEAAGEINLEDYSINDFFENYIEGTAVKYAGYSRGQLLDLMNKAENKETAIELVDERLNEWEETRPNKVAEEQAVKTAGAIARTVFASGGITKLIWIANSGACPICQEMNGTVVGIEESFMSPDDKILDFSPGGPKMHPPLHSGCICMISPG